MIIIKRIRSTLDSRLLSKEREEQKGKRGSGIFLGVFATSQTVHKKVKIFKAE